MNTNTETAALKPKDYRSDYKPIWCPGCGHFSVLSSVTKALSILGLKKEETAIVSGIGCSSRIPAYTGVYGIHGLHGRALALATGLKLARPDLTVLVPGGDGDAFSIGGNHFLHACRRNVDLTYIVMDNEVYGMTKGQASPTTAADWTGSKMTPHGPRVKAVNPMSLALAAGATFLARGFSGDPNEVARLIAEGVRHPGFAMIHVLSPCITYHPNQRDDWRATVRAAVWEETSNPYEAEETLRTDDGFNLGVLYRGSDAPYDATPTVGGDLEEIEAEFAL